jgi:WD40 repeat protein
MDILSSLDRYGTQQHLVASCGRDRLVHVYEISGAAGQLSCNHIQTIDSHSSSVTGIKFVYKDLESSHEMAAHHLQLITCSLDRSIAFRNLDLQVRRALDFSHAED